jgi:hypothetical protein
MFLKLVPFGLSPTVRTLGRDVHYPFAAARTGTWRPWGTALHDESLPTARAQEPTRTARLRIPERPPCLPSLMAEHSNWLACAATKILFKCRVGNAHLELPNRRTVGDAHPTLQRRGGVVWCCSAGKNYRGGRGDAQRKRPGGNQRAQRPV